MALNPKQQRFVAEYLKDLNATQAAIRAGYSEKTAKQIGSRLLTNVDVAEAIAKGQAKLAEKAGVTVEKIVGELAKIGFSDIRKVVNWQANVTAMVEDPDTGEHRMAVTNEVALVGSRDIDDLTAGAIAEISQTSQGGLKIKLHDKRAALVDLGKHLGMFTEKAEHKVTLETDGNSTPLELARGLAFVLALGKREAGTAPAAPAAPPMKH